MKTEYEQLIKRLEEKGPLIEAKRLKILEAKNKLDETNYSITGIEKYTAVDVADEVVPGSDKKAYTNQAARDAETLKRLKAREDYKTLKATALEIAKTRDILEIELERLYTDFKTDQYVVKVQQLSLISEAEETIHEQERLIEQLREVIRNLKAKQ